MPGEVCREVYVVGRAPGEESRRKSPGERAPGKESRGKNPREKSPGDMKELSGRKKCKRLDTVRSAPCALEKGHGAQPPGTMPQPPCGDPYPLGTMPLPPCRTSHPLGTMPQPPCGVPYPLDTMPQTLWRRRDSIPRATP